MIIFNGKSIESAAPVQIEDIKVSAIRYNPVTRPRAIRFGSEWVRMGGGDRTITITLAVLDRNQITRQDAFRALSTWARTDAEYKLELPQDPTRYLLAVCTSKPEPSTRAWWENKLRYVFTCFSDPYWRSKSRKRTTCGTEFTVYGDAPPLMQIERTNASDVSNRVFSNGTQTMTFSTVPAGEMTIDLNRQTAEVDGVSIMQYYTPASSFIVPKVGTQTITGTGVIRYRERWE